MEPTCKVPRLVFPDGFTDRDEWEMERKGFVYAFLECEDGCRYQVMFIDPVRLSQDIEATLQSGQSYYYEFGQIVVPEVTTPLLPRSFRFYRVQPSQRDSERRGLSPPCGSCGGTCTYHFTEGAPAAGINPAAR